MNRLQLSNAIMAWLHRAVLKTPIASEFNATAGFVALCEQDLNERLRARCMVVRANQVIDGQYSSLPGDYLEMLDLRLAGGGPPVNYVTRETTANAFWQAVNANPGNTAAAIGSLPPDWYPILNPPAYPWGDGTPRKYTIVGQEIEWSPFPTTPVDASGGTDWPVAEMAYYQRLNLGLNDTDSNSVLATYPACYIYGSLIHAAPFVRDDGRVALWKNLYESAVSGANTEHERSRTANMPLRQTYRRLA